MMQQLRLLSFLQFLGMLIFCVSGQDTVTIEPIPDLDTYAVGDNLTLMCILDPRLDPPPNDTSITVTYLWECSGCFADGLTTPTINRILTDMDTAMIDCTVDNGGNETMTDNNGGNDTMTNNNDGNVTITDMPFDLQVTRVPLSNVTFQPSSPVQDMVGDLLTVECRVDTVPGVSSSSVMISWTAPEGVTSIVSDSRVIISPTTSNGNVFTSNLQFTYLMEGDNGSYTCNWMILQSSGSETVELQLTIPTPTVSVTAPNTQTVGQSLTLQCEVTTVRGITSRVDIAWSSGGTELERTNSTTATTMGNSLVYTDSYTISQLSTTDEGRVIQCEVMINASPPVIVNNSVTLDVMAPTITVTTAISNNQVIVGNREVVTCTVSGAVGVNLSSVMINWMGPGGVITNDSRVTISPTTSSGNNFLSILQFEFLMEGDDGIFTCNVTILDTSVSGTSNLSTLIVPTPDVSVTAPNTQTVGQSLTLQCEVITVRGITSRVDIVWSSGDTELQRMNNVSSTTMDNSLVYTDSYTISQLSTTDEGRVIQCEVVINASPPIQEVDNIALDVTVPTPTVTISPPGPIQGPMVGSPQVIDCTVSTVSGVESSSVMISWMGPGGDPITTDCRVTISPTTFNVNSYISSLQFDYLVEGDEGNYTCNVMILGTSESDTVQLSLNPCNCTLSAADSQASSDDNNQTTFIVLITVVVVMAIGLIATTIVIILLMIKVKQLKSQYVISHREGGFTKVNESVSATKLHKKPEEMLYEPVDGDETHYAEPSVVSTTQSTGISMQENPAYMMHKAKITT